MEPNERYALEASHMANEYYSCARMSAYCGHTHIYGNLYHHAFELLLKAALSERVDIHQKKYKHDLKRLWEDFQKEFGQHPEFDIAIDAIHAYEDVRYPDQYMDEQIQLSISGFGKITSTINLGSQAGRYIGLNTHFLEKLWLLIYEMFGQNPEHSISIWRGLGKDIYLDKPSESNE